MTSSILFLQNNLQNGKKVELKIEINQCGLLQKRKLPPFIVKNNSYLWGKL